MLRILLEKPVSKLILRFMINVPVKIFDVWAFVRSIDAVGRCFSILLPRSLCLDGRSGWFGRHILFDSLLLCSVLRLLLIGLVRYRGGRHLDLIAGICRASQTLRNWSRSTFDQLCREKEYYVWRNKRLWSRGIGVAERLSFKELLWVILVTVRIEARFLQVRCT